MAISPMRYNGGFLSSSQVNGTKQQTATQKEVADLKRQQYEAKTPRELLDMPYGYTVTPIKNNVNKGLTAEDLFIVQYNSATTLSDGSKLLRPVSLALGKVDIKPTEDNQYEVTVQPHHGGHAIHRTMSEEELISNKSLSRGSIKKAPTEDGKKYFLNFVDKNGEERNFLATEKGCLKLLEENLLYM